MKRAWGIKKKKKKLYKIPEGPLYYIHILEIDSISDTIYRALYFREMVHHHQRNRRVPVRCQRRCCIFREKLTLYATAFSTKYHAVVHYPSYSHTNAGFVRLWYVIFRKLRTRHAWKRCVPHNLVGGIYRRHADTYDQIFIGGDGKYTTFVVNGNLGLDTRRGR